MKIFVDVDNTICKTIGTDYANAKPLKKKIAIINEFYDQGHEITYWTARGSGSGIDWYELTKEQLAKWGVKYHNFMVGKPVYDIFIDDKTFNKITTKLKLCLQKEVEVKN